MVCGFLGLYLPAFKGCQAVAPSTRIMGSKHDHSKGQGFILAWSIPSIRFNLCKASYLSVMKDRRLLLIFSCPFIGFAQRKGSRPLYCRVLFLQWAVDRLFSFTCHLHAHFWQPFPFGWEGFCWSNIVSFFHSGEVMTNTLCVSCEVRCSSTSLFFSFKFLVA